MKGRSALKTCSGLRRCGLLIREQTDLSATENSINYTELANFVTNGHLNNVKVCITGKLNDFSSRSKAEDKLSSVGVKLMKSVSKNIDYLICDKTETSSSSYKTAESLNVPIVTMDEFLNNYLS